jgi:hypothetical protein
MYNLHAQPGGRCHLGIVRFNGRADRQRLGLRRQPRAILRDQRHALPLQFLQHVQGQTLIMRTVGPGDVPTLIEQRLRQRAHADPGHAGDVDLAHDSSRTVRAWAARLPGFASVRKPRSSVASLPPRLTARARRYASVN